MVMKRKAVLRLFGFLLSCVMLAGCQPVPAAGVVSSALPGASGAQESASSTSSAADEKKPMAGGIRETVYFHNNGTMDADKIKESWQIVDSMTENRRKELTEEFLRTWDVYKEAPDGAAGTQGRPLLEYYSNEAKRITGVIFHLWSQRRTLSEEFWGKGEPDEWIETATYCTLLHWDDLEKRGTLVYDRDAEQRTRWERYYDPDGVQKQYIAYEYAEGLPIPLITQYEGPELQTPSCDEGNVLNQPQRFWLYQNLAEYDAAGRLQKYKGTLHAGDRAVFQYDGAGRLQTIREETDQPVKGQEDNFSGKVTFTYRDDGSLDTMDYGFLYWGSSTDCSGAAAYDEQGRLVYRHYYITHGYHYRVYLYNGEETRPWAWMEFCTQALSSPDEETGVYYGCDCFYYLFEKQEAAAG